VDTRLARLSELPVGRGEGERFAGREEVRLAKAVGVTQFGVNQVTLASGARTASRHWHAAEDEFVYVVSGTPTLIDENGPHALEAGSVVGFPAGVPNAHHLVNQSAEPAVLIVVGSRRPGEETITYPDDNFGPIRK
jgi:uncharacterized cupin superfamily protein